MSYAKGSLTALTLAHVAGDLPHDKPEDQAVDLPQFIITDVKEAAQKAVLQIQPTRIPERIYTDGKQKNI